MSIGIVVVCIILLVLLIVWGKLNAFLAFMLVSILAGCLLQLPAAKIMVSIQHGIGDTLGSLVSIICLGAMLGKLVAESGAAQKIATVLMKCFGVRYLQWALMITGFIIGIPLFYGVGFVLMVPLIFSIVYQYKLPAVYIGLPMLAALSVTHGFLPPHPSPSALVIQLKAEMGLTLLYGLAIAIPAIIIAGPLFTRFIKSVKSEPLEMFRPQPVMADQLPGAANSFLTSLLPVFLLTITTVLTYCYANVPSVKSLLALAGEPAFIMLLSVLIAAFTLGIARGKSMSAVMAIYGDAIKDVGMILLIIAGSGALKQVLTDSGVSNQIAAALKTWPVNPLVLGWCMSGIIRICIGSATIAGLTTAGIIAPLVVASGVNANLMVLAVGSGSLLFSHVNDPGFWLFKEYFNLSIKDTLKTWSVMETIVALTGLAGVLLLQAIIG